MKGILLPNMLLPIFTNDAMLINQLIGFAKRNVCVYYFIGYDHLTTTEIYLNLSSEMALSETQEKW